MSIVLARHERGQRGVIFTRTIELLEALREVLAPLAAHISLLHGKLGDEERRIAVDRFRGSQAGLLLMTRTTGGRGLDLPFAHYCIFYTTKTDASTMWQELSRIRSTVSTPKDSYVLCYGSGESDILKGVLNELKGEGKAVVHQLA